MQVHNIMIQPKQPAALHTEISETVQVTEVSQNMPQQVPTIQLMINTTANGGNYLGINVNNYCIAPQPAVQQNHS
jgi:hypothetical protein